MGGDLLSCLGCGVGGWPLGTETCFARACLGTWPGLGVPHVGCDPAPLISPPLLRCTSWEECWVLGLEGVNRLQELEHGFVLGGGGPDGRLGRSFHRQRARRHDSTPSPNIQHLCWFQGSFQGCTPSRSRLRRFRFGVIPAASSLSSEQVIMKGLRPA